MEFLFVLETVTTMENVLLPTLVLVSEEKWVLNVKLIVDVQDMEHVMLMAPVNVIRDSSLTPLLKSVNFHVLINQVLTVLLQIHWVVVRDVLVVLVKTVHVHAGQDLTEQTVQLKFQ